MPTEREDDDWVGLQLSAEADRFDLDLDGLMARVMKDVHAAVDGQGAGARRAVAPVAGDVGTGRSWHGPWRRPEPDTTRGSAVSPGRPVGRFRLVPIAIAAATLIVGTALPGLGAWRSDHDGTARVQTPPGAEKSLPTQTMSIAPRPPSLSATPTPTDTATPGPGRTLTRSFRWSSSGPLISPKPDATHNATGIKDASVVYADGRWHVFATAVGPSLPGLVYLNFTDWAEAGSAPQHYLDSSAIGGGYRAAPQVFYFAPQKLWYLVYQTGNASYSTNPDISNPNGWSAPKDFYGAGMPDIVKRNIGNDYWVDMWVICDAADCYLFSTDQQGHLYRSQTTRADFPNGMSQPVVALQDANRLNMLNSISVYKVAGTGQYLLLMEAIASDGASFVRSWTSASLTGSWTPLAATESNPFARAGNVSFKTETGTRDIGVGEIIRTGDDQTLTISPCRLRFVYSGQGEKLGLLTQTNSSCS
jgi:endo-1,4-beta-xylanase